MTAAWLRHTLLAQDCVLCAAPSGAALVCHGCTADLPLLGPSCPRCAESSPTGAVCGACLARPPAFDATIAAWRYAFPVDRLVQSLKYGGALALASLFAAALVDAARGRPVDVLLPMPLARGRLRERGFNQAMEIARRTARLLDRPLRPHLAARHRDTAPQADLPFDERAANVRGVFACNAVVAGMRIAVVDDVMTTGATLDELARTLKRAGALHVENWVVARTWRH
jgi:ComF family protein